MLKRTKIVSLLSADKTMPQVLLKGWVRTRRDAKDFSFIEITNGFMPQKHSGYRQ